MIALSPKALISAYTVKYDLVRNDKLLLSMVNHCVLATPGMSSRDGKVWTSTNGPPEILAGKMK